MSLFRRGLKAAIALAVLLCVAFLVGTVASRRPGDPGLFPADPAEAIPVYLTSNGFHSGLVLPVSAVGRLAGRDGEGALVHVARRFAGFQWVEIGWGEARFYRGAASTSGLDLRSGLRALFRPGNGSVLHVVGVKADPRDVFGAANTVRIPLSEAGLARLIRALNDSFAQDGAGSPQILGPGLYGPSLFYRAVGSFSILNLCNHWTARLLDEAGVPTSPVLATLPMGLIWDLKWRSGLGGNDPSPMASFGKPQGPSNLNDY